MKNQGRKVEFKTFRRATKEEHAVACRWNHEQTFVGTFHGWGSEMEEGEGTVATNSVGIIEHKSGEVYTVSPGHIKFLDKPITERKRTHIKLTGAEIQSGSDRQKHAEGLITQLPKDHDGRNTWLLNYGRNPESDQKRTDRGIRWNNETQSADLTQTQKSK